MPNDNKTTCCCEKKNKWYQNKIFVVFICLLFIFLLSFYVPFLIPFRDNLIGYFKSIWWAILLGLFIGGVIDYYVPRQLISNSLAKKEKRTIFKAVFLGFFMSVCSHGILALAIQLYKKGASTSAVVAFLLASPWANLPLTLILVGFFGLAKALFIIFSAIIIAIITGFVYQKLEAWGVVENNPGTEKIDENFSFSQSLKDRFRDYKFSLNQIAIDISGVVKGMISLSDMVLWWVLVGTALAGLAGAYVPHNIFHQYLGPTFSGMIITLVVATIIEVCSEGSSPLAFEIYRQTGSVGNSLVFLMAGVATDYTEIGLLWHNIGKKTAIWLPVVTVPQIILFGIIANLLFS